MLRLLPVPVYACLVHYRRYHRCRRACQVVDVFPESPPIICLEPQPSDASLSFGVKDSVRLMTNPSIFTAAILYGLHQNVLMPPVVAIVPADATVTPTASPNISEGIYTPFGQTTQTQRDHKVHLVE